MAGRASTTDAETQLEELHRRSSQPKHQTLLRAVRKALRKRFPTAHELVYDNYNFFVIGYGSTERPSDCIVSMAGGASGVNLFFLHGKKLRDPKKILLGSGSAGAFHPPRVGRRAGAARGRGVTRGGGGAGQDAARAERQGAS